MNAVACRKSDTGERDLMVTSDSYDFGIKLAELRSDVRHIQSDVTDIKVAQRATNDRLERLSDSVNERFDKLGRSVDERFVKFSETFTGRLDATNDRISTLSNRIDDRLDKLTNALWSAKVWALALYLALAGSLLYVLARGSSGYEGSPGPRRAIIAPPGTANPGWLSWSKFMSAPKAESAWRGRYRSAGWGYGSSNTPSITGRPRRSSSGMRWLTG
jgi:hypothetical protein